MKRPGAIAIYGLLLLGLASIAQAVPPQGFTKVAETAHFVHYSRAGRKGRVADRERQIQSLESRLGVKVEGRVEFYDYDGPEQIAAVTGQYVEGYFYPKRAELHATRVAEAHEIVHVAAYGLGDPGSFFQEGLAVALGNQGQLGGRNVDRESRRLLAKLSPSALVAGQARVEAWESSAAAGSFVAWLIDRHGLPKVAAFFHACGNAQSPVAFEASFGQPLASASEAWASSLGVRPQPTGGVRMAALAP